MIYYYELFDFISTCTSSSWFSSCSSGSSIFAIWNSSIFRRPHHGIVLWICHLALHVELLAHDCRITVNVNKTRNCCSNNIYGPILHCCFLHNVNTRLESSNNKNKTADMGYLYCSFTTLNMRWNLSVAGRVWHCIKVKKLKVELQVIPHELDAP